MFQTMLNAAMVPIQFLATAVVAEPVRPEDASLVFSGPRFWIAVISGILLAFAFQIVLTNLSVATGISILGRSSDHDDHDDHKSGGSFGSTVKKIGLAVGAWTLITVTIALFFACYLAVRLSLLSDNGLGAIVGLVIWAGYYCLLVFFSSTTVGSLIGSVVNSATSGFQAILGTATAALGGRAASNQVVATAEAAAAAVRRELVPNVDPGRIRDTVEDYIDRIRPADLDIASIRKEFESILSDPEVRSMVGPQGVQVDRQKFVDLVSSRTDLSKRDVDRIASQLETVWQQTLGRSQPGQEQKPDQMTQLIDYLRSTQEGQIDSKEVSNKLDQLIAEIRNSRQTEQQSDQQQNKSQSRLQALQANVMPIVGMLMGRTDLSDMSIEKIIGQVKSAQTTVTTQASKVAAQVSDEPVSTVRADIENYLHNAYFFELSRDAIDREFREIIYDPAADPRAVREQLERINRSDFVSILSDRGMFTQTRIQEIADQLESIRREVMTTALAAEERQASLELRQMVETYLTYTPQDRLYPDEIDRAFGAILSSDADHDTLTLRLAAYDRASLREILARRSDIAPAEIDPILDALEATRDRILFESQNLADQAKERTQATWTKLQDYLRNTGKDELNPDAIKNDLQLLLNDPQAGLAALRSRASSFDRDTLVQLLNQRQDLSEDQINGVINQVEGSWHRVTNAPQELTAVAKDQYDQVTTSLADYLRNTNKEALDPQGIQRDLNLLFNDPQAGMYALRRRLSQVDRDTLVKLLSQRQDLSEEQVNQVIDQVQENIRKITGAPRRVALRTQQRVMDFETAIEQYLRNTDKEELDPEGIKRDLQLLARDPRLGVSNLGQRLSRFDRNTIVSLLAQRPDMTPEEAERIVAQIESQRDRILLQLQDVQYRIQGAIDNIFARIRRYLNNLERPELNYDSIKADLRTMMDDPQAGFDALRHRLGQVDRGTLVALLSSRRDISEADANRLIDQVESARTSVLQRAERIQTEAQRRLEDVKRQAQKQAEDTRKAAATAAWWLFATAVVSAIASAVAGAIAI